jgi:antitoxin PrlF
MTATITSKGQITIPKEVRDRLNLKPGSRVDFVIGKSGKVTLKPLNWEWRDLIGIVKSSFKRPVTVEEMNEMIAQGYARSGRSKK